MSLNLWILSVLCWATISLSDAGSAFAAQEIVLIGGQSQLVSLPEEPVTLVVGNPAIADITIEGKTLFVHPRAYGVTNLIAMDAQGKKLGDYLVRTIYDDSYGVAMYSPSGRKSYSCRKDCEPVMRIGDTKDSFENFASQARAQNSLAASQALGEELMVPTNNTYAIAPPPPSF